MSKMDQLAKDLKKIIDAPSRNKTSAYNTTAEVTRVEDNIIWVHIPGGVAETPIEKTMDAKPGDSVNVHIENGAGWIIGNSSSPPTDDTAAMKAMTNAVVAQRAADQAKTDANKAHKAANIAKATTDEIVAYSRTAEKTVTQILEDGVTARETTDEIVEYSETAEKTVTEILEDGETARIMASQAISDAATAKTSADTAVVNLSLIQSVLDVVNWVSTHGYYAKTTDSTINPNKTYYTLIATAVVSPTVEYISTYYELVNGSYVKTTDTQIVAGKTYYTIVGAPVSEPKQESIGTYYELNISDAMSQYIMSHLALTNDGLYVMKDASKWKVLVKDNGIDILDGTNGADIVKSQYGENITIGEKSDTHIQITKRAFKMIDTGASSGETYVHFSDLRDAEGYYSTSQICKRKYEGGTYEVLPNSRVKEQRCTLNYTAVLDSFILTDGSHEVTYDDLRFWHPRAYFRPYNHKVVFSKNIETGTTISITYQYVTGSSPNYVMNSGSYTFTTTEEASSFQIPDVSNYQYFEILTVTVNGLATPGVEIYSGYVQFYGTYFANASEIQINYKTTSKNAKAFTFGTRDNEYPIGPSSFTSGRYCAATNANSAAIGYACVAAGTASFAAGRYCEARSQGAIAMGEESIVTSGSAAIGYKNNATGNYASAFGEENTASGMTSFTEGWQNTASGSVSHAGGWKTEASGDYSFTHGEGTSAIGSHQMAIGEWNSKDSSTGNSAKYFIIGNGYSDSSRSTCMYVTAGGDVAITGNYNKISDKRLKEHISYLSEDAIHFIRDLKPVYYNKNGEPHLGFYAQDVEEIDTWGCMIGEEMNGYKTLGYSEIIAPLVAYCQNLESRIRILESKEDK